MANAQNQFFPTLPMLPGTGGPILQPQNKSTALAAPAPGGNGLAVPGAGKGFNVSPQNAPYNPYTWDVGGGYRSGSTLSPNETASFLGFLQSQMGKGATPFNLSTALPGGGKTAPGQLNAPLDSVLNQLLQFFGTGGKTGGLPGMTQMSDIAKNGISAVAPWQTMKDAMQRQIAEGRTNLQEQFNTGGGLVGSPYGTAAADYELQSNKDLNSLLANMQFQGIGMQQHAQDQLMGEGTDFGKFLQSLDQESIQNMLQEFIRTRPEYNPMIPYQGQLATTFPPMVGNKVSTNPLAGLLPAAASGIGAGAAKSAGGAAAGGSAITGLLAMLAAL